MRYGVGDGCANESGEGLREGVPPHQALYLGPFEPRRHRTAFGGGTSVEERGCDACEGVKGER